MTAADAHLDHDCLTEVLDLLYPAPCSLTGEGSHQIAEYVVVSRARRPEMLIPAGSRRVAAAAVRRFAGPPNRMWRPALFRTRVRVTAPRRGTDSIDAYLRRCLGAELTIAVQIGQTRHPVLQLLTPGGRTFGFARLGTSTPTRRSVRAETDALTTLSEIPLDTVAVPHIIHTGQWNGHDVLVQSALPAWRPRAPLSPYALTNAMLEVAYARGTSRSWLATSAYWTGLRNRLAEVEDQPGGSGLAEAARQLIDRCGRDIPLTFGSWHGDWSPATMANVAAGEHFRERLLLWGWEHYASGVPMGYDALHYELQRRLQTETDARACVRDLVTQAPTLLDPFDVVHDGRTATALLYLTDLATRHLAGDLPEADWLLPELVDRMGRLA